MSALPVPRRQEPPTFTAYTEVEVDIDAEDLERAGWVFVGKDDSLPTEETVLDIVRRWHERNHQSAWAWCDDELCDLIRGRKAN